jgi:hypothetical protein
MGACSAAMGGASACGTDEMDFARWLGPDVISNNETLAPVPEGDSKSEIRRVPTQTNTRSYCTTLRKTIMKQAI